VVRIEAQSHAAPDENEGRRVRTRGSDSISVLDERRCDRVEKKKKLVYRVAHCQTGSARTKDTKQLLSLYQLRCSYGPICGCVIEGDAPVWGKKL